MRYLPLLCLACLLAASAPAAAEEQFGSFTLRVINRAATPLSFQVNQGPETTLAPGQSGRYGQAFDQDRLAASPDYLFQVKVTGQEGGPSCSVQVRVEVSAWGDDFLFYCSPRRVLVGPCLLVCDYDSVGPSSRARLVYRPNR